MCEDLKKSAELSNVSRNSQLIALMKKLYTMTLTNFYSWQLSIEKCFSGKVGTMARHIAHPLLLRTNSFTHSMVLSLAGKSSGTRNT